MIPVKKKSDSLPVLGVNQPVDMPLCSREEILPLALNLQLSGLIPRGKLRIVIVFTVNIIDLIVLRRQAFRDLRIGDVHLPVFFHGQLRLHFRVDIPDADDNMHPVPGHDLRMPDIPDPPVHDQAPYFGKRIPAFQVVQHHVLVMQPEGHLPVLRMDVLPDASSAVGKKIHPRCRHVQLFVFIRRRDLAVGAILDIHVIQGIILRGQTGGNLIVDLPLLSIFCPDLIHDCFFPSVRS